MNNKYIFWILFFAAVITILYLFLSMWRYYASRMPDTHFINVLSIMGINHEYFIHILL